MDLLSLSFVSAAALVGTIVMIADVLGVIKIDVSVNVWFGDKPDGSP